MNNSTELLESIEEFVYCDNCEDETIAIFKENEDES